MNEKQAANGFVHDLTSVLKPFREGECPVWINYRRNDTSAVFALGQDWRVQPSDELMSRLDSMVGHDNVRVVYGAE